MNYQPIFTKHSVIFQLHKPIFGSYYGIWDKWLKKAGSRNIIINTKEGTATFKNAKEYMGKAKRMERYYKNPDVPMIFYGLSVFPEITKRNERKKVEKKLESPKIELDTKLKLAQRIIDKNPDLAIKLGLL